MSEQLGFDFQGGAESSTPTPPSAEPDAVPTVPDGAGEPVALDGLRVMTRVHPYDRKLLVGTTRGEGRELLRLLARSGTPWIGWEATTLGPLAAELAALEIGRRGLSLLDAFDVARLMDEAIDRVLVHRGVEGFSELAESLGFRRSLQGTVRALRLGGIGPGRVATAAFQDERKRTVLADILRAFETLKDREGGLDEADVLRLALAALAAPEAAPVPRIVLLAGVPKRGLAGALVQQLLERGATIVAADPVVGSPAPAGIVWKESAPVSKGSFLHDVEHAVDKGLTLDVFTATTVTAELREVLRRVVGGGHALDEVEIVTPDARTYGSALHQLCERLGIPVTFGVGLPVERTRPGRVVTEFFRWLDTGFSADVVRSLLEAGDLRPHADPEGPAPMDLGRRFRELRIGWGRRRYLERIDRRVRSLETMVPGRYESTTDMEWRKQEVAAELEALRSILAPTLEALPDGLPDPAAGPGSAPVTPAELARALGHFLDCVVPRDAADQTALDSLRQVLERVQSSLTRPSEYRAAAAALQVALDIRVPSPRDEGRAPWSTRHGHLHLTDIDHGGHTGRRLTFVVGMDSGRFPAAGRQDPLLLDGERLSVGKGALPTARERMAEATFSFARLLARLRGSVTVSHASWEPAEARALSPAADVLATYRLASGDTEALFETLRQAEGDAVGVVPASARLDAQDVWMAALFRAGRSLDGRAAVATAFPSQAAGARAVDAPRSDELSSWVGALKPRAELDPRQGTDRVVSASALEALGTCPRRYLFRDVLRLRRPEEPRFDPDRWLSPLDRGNVLHRVYERTLRRARELDLQADDPTLLEEALKTLARETDRAREMHPAPSRAVQRRELQALHADVESFLALVRERGISWVALEKKFGFDDEPPVDIRLYDGVLRMRGAIDRIDERDDGVVVIDYKTGGAYAAEGDTGTFDGGRRLQNVVYTMVAREISERPVSRMEYHFATRRARNSVLAYTPDELKNGPFLIDRMLDGVRAGAFPATDDAQDCRWCDFRPICRVRGDGDRPESPHAAWSRRAMSRDGDVTALLASLRDVRREEGPGIALPLEILRERTDP